MEFAMRIKVNSSQSTANSKKVFSLFLRILILALGLSLPAHGGTKGGEIGFASRDSKDHMQYPMATVMDSNNNVIMTGYSQENYGMQDNNFYTVKFDSAGTVVWSASFDYYAGPDFATGVAVDGSGNAIVVGYGFNGTTDDIIIIKYASDYNISGNSYRVNLEGFSPDTDSASDVAVDSSGNVYVGGHTKLSNYDYIIMKFSPAADPDMTLTLDTTFGGGNGYVTYNGTSNKEDRISSIIADDNGVIITGYTQDGSGYDCLTLKYAHDNSNNNPVFEHIYAASAGSGMDIGVEAAIDGNGDVYVLCEGTDQYSHTTMDLIKLDGASTGTATELWVKTYTGGQKDKPVGIALDSGDNVYMTGQSRTLYGSEDIFTIKYDGLGNAKWGKIFNSLNDTGNVNNDSPKDIVVSSAGDVYVTGYTYDTVTKNKDFRTLKYSGTDGLLLWDELHNGHDTGLIGPDSGEAVMVSTGGDVYVGGWSDNTQVLVDSTSTGVSTTYIDDSNANGGSGWTEDWSEFYVRMTSGANSGDEKKITGNTGFRLNVVS
ncbi:MAG: SBBP repeat-containing protein, partial [Planctomycetota bacterium]